jgi:ATP-dependent RNA helicase DeaD
MNDIKTEEITADKKKGFGEIGLKPEIIRALDEAKYFEMFPIQEGAIKPLLEGRDVIGQAHTGSGKTAAFSLPLIQKLDGTKPYVQSLVVVPTRELALQVTDEFNKLAKYTGVKAFPIYGGQAITPQIERLSKRTPQVVVATPGRLIDHIERETIELSDVRTVILDEADRMLDMGFIEDVDYILKHLPTGSQTALFSATMPQEIVRLSQRYMDNPVEVLIDTDEISLETIEQRYALVDDRDKFAALVEYIKRNKISSGIIFCSTKFKTQRLSERMQAAGFRAAPIHGDLSQNQREHAMRNFRSGHVELLIATDVAARGIDVPKVSHVINYEVPQDPLTYFHRIGRTARAGKTGSAMTFVSGAEYPDFRRITGMTEVEITKMTGLLPEGYRPSREERFTGDLRRGNRERWGRRPQRGGRFEGRAQRSTNWRDNGRSERPSSEYRSSSSGFQFVERVSTSSSSGGYGDSGRPRRDRRQRYR